MEVTENDGKEYEDNHDGGTETAPYCRKNFRALYVNSWFEDLTLNTVTKVFVNTMLHWTIAPRTIMVKTILKWLKL